VPRSGEQPAGASVRGPSLTRMPDRDSAPGGSGRLPGGGRLPAPALLRRGAAGAVG
jgi:hypothetical protein